MAVTTTLKLPEDLKDRIAPLAAAQGKSPHAWMVDALQAQVALADMRSTFVADALAAAEQIDQGGALYAGEEVAAYLRGAWERAAAAPPPAKAAPWGAKPADRCPARWRAGPTSSLDFLNDTPRRRPPRSR
ncbi:MAG: hypothetical protein IPM01_10150 [Burkholderiaceae bacterium]|nr:hypothetical protein [Burkholderiaceae bacterium]